MSQSLSVVGWTSAYLSNYPTTSFTEERRKALIERMRKRKYNFTYEAHQTLPYAAPFYSDNFLCVLTKAQWDSVLNEVYKDMPCSMRLMPDGIIDRKPINTVLYEKPKYEPEGEK